MMRSTLVGAACLALALGVTLPANVDTTDVKIRARDGWQRVAYVQAGQFVDISAEGRWTVDYRRDKELGGRIGPEGYDWNTDEEIGFQERCHVTDDAPYGTLIGRIGRGPVFVVGEGDAFDAEHSGRLGLRINDANACLGDNGGRVNVTVDIG